MSIRPEIFARFAVLRGLSLRSAEQLARKALPVRGRAGEVLYPPGQACALTYFLISGEIEFVTPAGTVAGRLDARDAAAGQPFPDTARPQLGARCVGNVSGMAIDSALLEVTLDWGREARIEVGSISEGDGTPDDWMLRLLQHRSFQQLPGARLQAMFLRMQPMDVRAGDVVIRQNEAGEHFYVVVDGRCQVLRETPDQAPLPLAIYRPGDCFGEDALLSGAARNATVVAMTRGRLLRLARADFTELLSQTWTRRIDFAAASALVASGTARWLDVRPPGERNHELDAAIGIPYYLLRSRAGELARDVDYICVCDNGRRSAVAAFILTHRGLNAYTLAGGLEEGSTIRAYRSAGRPPARPPESIRSFSA